MTKTEGFSLVEIVVATALIGLVLFFLISVLPTANLALHKSEDLESVNTYGEEVLEATKLTLPAATPLPACPLAPKIVKSSITINNMCYNVQTTVTQVGCQQTFTDVYYLFEISVVLIRTNGKGVSSGNPIQKVTRVMVRAPKPCPG